MRSFWSCFFLIWLASAATFGVDAVNLEGTTLLSLVRHWKVVPSPIKLSWNASDSTPCFWLGVICNPNNIVVELNISSLSISGELGPEIGYLNHLESIDLSYNSFPGRIPSLLGNCSYLESLDLSNNFFHGEIPENLGNLRRLRVLSLWSNNLGGEIPGSLFRIPSLRLIYLNNNNLTGSIPRDLGNLSLVEQLFLNNNVLSGTIPSSIGNCSALQELYLNDNLFEGALPNSLNSLDHLQFLFVENNNLVGRIPNLGSCKELGTLVLSFNQFSEGIPTGLGNCSSLTSLAAVGCGLSGPIPSALGRLTKLSLLYLSENRLSGSIPPELGNCEALTDLQLYGNELSGAVPSELGMLDQLQIIMLFTNNFSGEIPSSIWRIQSLQQLIVYKNNLVGEIPEEITELKELSYLSLFDNQFTGVLPQGLGINGSLTQVDLSRNKFTGPIPPNLCFGKKLRRLILGQNRFNGSISSDVGRCTSLTRLILKENSLEGRIPDFVKHSGLEYMDISNNRISGSIPSSFGDLGNVSFIDFSHNNLVGGIPLEMGSLLNLEYLSLSHNRLEGMLPSQLSGCHKLSELDLRNNLLNGTIPSSLRSLKELSVLDLSENHLGGGVLTTLFHLGKLSSLQLGANQLGGAIPPSIGLGVAAQSLRSLNLSRNGLIGRLPVEFGKLKMLEKLDISCNNLSGSLETVGELRSLTEINVSYNSFAGPIQPAVMEFLISSPSSFVGNQDLCIDCRGSCEGSNSSSNAFKMCHSRSRKTGLSRVGLATVVSGSSLFAVILVLGVSYMFFRHKGREVNLLGDAEEGASSLLRQVMEATENLQEKYIVGRGAHGTVYKVALSPTKAYALKKLSFAGSKGGNASMVREIRIIGSVRHRNLVRLEDFWLRKNYGLILYPYMESGSLHDVLHKSLPRPPLKWEVRYRIALGAAQGLMYLHFDCDPPIIHRDIKPMNILLDSDMEPHISDFGIAKLLDESVSSTQVAVQGTIGYIAPERAFSTRSSRESDVYAYGVVLLELVTRRRVLDESFGEGVDVVGWARGAWDEGGDVRGIVDRDVVDELLDSSTREQVEGVVSLALRCTDEEAGKRPSMREVVKQLVVVVVESRSRSKHR
ncbi:receptor-like protein kinase [Salvia divinorum]|uniref:non-specific serine/threonine protein kinase n=1 Tax=Salvia divinorum TaxID=28513 RepID=A0ABD1G1N6_SALDI